MEHKDKDKDKEENPIADRSTMSAGEDESVDDVEIEVGQCDKQTDNEGMVECDKQTDNEEMGGNGIVTDVDNENDSTDSSDSSCDISDNCDSTDGCESTDSTSVSEDTSTHTSEAEEICEAPPILENADAHCKAGEEDCCILG